MFFSEKSDSSSQRSKSENRSNVVRQSSAPISTTKRMARAKDLIIPAFTSAGRRIRRPSVDQGPIQIKLGRSDSTKSIEENNSLPKVSSWWKLMKITESIQQNSKLFISITNLISIQCFNLQAQIFIIRSMSLHNW